MKQKDNSDKLSRAINRPGKTLEKFIERASLTPLNADLDFDFSPFSVTEVIPNLKQYPKLFNYLSVEVNQDCFWQVAFDEIKKIREFIKIFVEIAEHYQEACKRATENERLMRLGYGKPLPEEILSDLRNINFHITNKPYSNSLLGGPLFPKGAREIEIDALAVRLSSFMVNSFSLTVDKNHLANISISQGEFLDVIKGTDLRRLKKCLVCSNVFWAYRLNAKFCSMKCSDNFHKRKQRNEEYKSRLGKLHDEQKEQRAKLEKLQAYPAPIPALVEAQKKLLDENTKKVNKLTQKIKEEKKKNESI